MDAGWGSHRKLVKHAIKPGVARELTFSCYRRLPLLHNDAHKRMLSEAIDRAMGKHGFELVAFVYMPEHVHLIVFPNRPEASVSGLLAGIKRPHGFRVKRVMQQSRDPSLGGVVIRERPGRTVFRFWQEGSGYDRDIVDPAYLVKAAEYVHANPVRRGLCERPEDWLWSSWHWYHRGVRLDGLPVVHGFPET